jgi:hypothetical protein
MGMSFKTLLTAVGETPTFLEISLSVAIFLINGYIND